MLLRSLFFVAGVCAAQTSNPLSLRIPNVTVPLGGTAQIQVYAGSPVPLVSGELVLSLDPAVFGPIVAADVFSATGDQVGTADIQDRRVDVKFRSGTGGIGRLPALPILAVTVPALATATLGNTSTITVSPGNTSTWSDTQGVKYTVLSASGMVTVGGALSISSVTPGGGLSPPGTVVKIGGTGFAPDTKITADGVALQTVQFVSAQEMDVTLAGAADLTGKRVVARNADGSQVVFFSALRGSYVTRPSSGPLATLQPIFPQQLYPAADAGVSGYFNSTGAGIALQNPTLDSVDVQIKDLMTQLNGLHVTGSVVTLPPGGIWIVSGSQIAYSYRNDSAYVVPAKPIRMVLMEPAAGGTLMGGIPVPVPSAFLQPDNSYQAYPTRNPNPIAWNVVAGSTPAPVKFDVMLTDLPLPFTVSASTASGGSWLSVSPPQGTTCNGPDLPNGPPICPDSAKISIAVDISRLAPGTYNGSIQVALQGFGGLPTSTTTVPVQVNVSAVPLVSVSSTNWDFGTPPANGQELKAGFSITSNADPTAFSIAVKTSSGQDWLSALPQSGNTPASLVLTADPSKVPSPGDSATVSVIGPNNTQSIAVTIKAIGTETITTYPAGVTFTLPTGSGAGTLVSFPADLAPSLTISTQTDDGAKWLSASMASNTAVPEVSIAVNAAGLSPGTYHGAVVLSSPQAAGAAQVPVTFYVWDAQAPPKITVSPASVNLTAPAGSAVPGQSVDITTGGVPMPYDLRFASSEGGNWVWATIPNAGGASLQTLTPVTITVGVNSPTPLPPGVYHGTVTVTAPPNSTNTATVPVTLTVTPALPQPTPLVLPQGTLPLVSTVLNAASMLPAAVSPGEIVTIFGQNIGPSQPAGFVVGPDGKVATTLGGARVLFDGVPAPLLYASATQINAVVPYEIENHSVTDVQVQLNEASIPGSGIPVASAAPGIFAVLNQDNTVNSVLNPALRGSVLQIFATGEGGTSPDGITGEIIGSEVKQPVLPVTVTIGGERAAILYAGSAPNAVAGLFQVDATVPQSLLIGQPAALVLTVGNESSPPVNLFFQ